MIRRTTKKNINSLLTKNKDWKILDIGCGYSADEHANTICDVQDLSNFYKDRNFIKLDSNKLPFKDKEFNFVIASHVMEHVEDIETFINELERVSNKGYIELPTKLEDNLVFENKHDHIWHMDFDDVNLKLFITKKIQVLDPIFTVSTIQKMRKHFRNSFVMELYWEDKIDFELFRNEPKFDKISLLTLFRKFISKKIRSLFN